MQSGHILEWVAISFSRGSRSLAFQADALPSEPVEEIKPICKVVSTK